MYATPDYPFLANKPLVPGCISYQLVGRAIPRCTIVVQDQFEYNVAGSLKYLREFGTDRLFVPWHFPCPNSLHLVRLPTSIGTHCHSTHSLFYT